MHRLPPPPGPLRAHPHPQRSKGPPFPPGLDLPLIAQRPQAQATNPPEMHLRAQCTAACHCRGHPRGRPGTLGPQNRGAGETPQLVPPASRAAWAARVLARGASGVAGVCTDTGGLQWPQSGTLNAPASAGEPLGVLGTDLNWKLQRQLAQ